MSRCAYCGGEIATEWTETEVGPSGAMERGYKAYCECGEAFAPGQPPCEEGPDELAERAARAALEALIEGQLLTGGQFELVITSQDPSGEGPVEATVDCLIWGDLLDVALEYMSLGYRPTQLSAWNRSSGDGSITAEQRVQFEHALTATVGDRQGASATAEQKEAAQ